MTDRAPLLAAWHSLKTRLARGLSSRRTPPRTLEGLVGRVHPDDTMLFDDSAASVENYRRAAVSALENLELALSQAGRSFSDVESCLDFGCGYGRVLRYLQERIPPDRVTACDAVAPGVRFCAEEFGVRPLYASWDVSKLRLGRYDLIWSGSVFTHLDDGACRTLFTKLAESLVPGKGQLVFSVHGEFSLGALDSFYEGLYAAEADTIRGEVAASGISFRAYEDERFGRFPVPYGMTWHSTSYFEELARELFGDGLELQSWRPHGWDSHHDVLAFQRRR